jgi:SAM-dependent methyltransferase
MAGKLLAVSDAAREQRLVFGEVADQYDAARPSYPDALFDTIVDFGALRAGDRALEVGAGTGKATTGFVARGLDVHALEPSPEMAAVLRAKGVDVEETLFESWSAPTEPFRLVYAAQAWHWVGGDDRFERAAAALEPGGTVAFFWNLGRNWTGPLREENDAAYAQHAPELSNEPWSFDWVREGIAACSLLEPPVMRSLSWTQTYTSADWVQFLGTHSNHRMLPADRRARLYSAVGDAIDRYGGRVEVVYDVKCHLGRRVDPR